MHTSFSLHTSNNPFPKETYIKNSSRRKEHLQRTTPLHQRTRFPYATPQRRPRLTEGVLSFRFRSIAFQKKRSLPFFLALELLTHQKCIATLSSRNVLSRRIRKGRLVGCRVTLRQASLTSFLDTLSLALPRREKFLSTSHFKGKKNYLKTKEDGVARRFSELVLFYPFERGLGLHEDVQTLQFRLRVSSLTLEERYFLLRTAKLPRFF